MDERVVISVADQVAHVELNRPEKRNGLDLPMFEALIVAGQTIIADKSIRAVVLSGRGHSFCAGLDFQSILATPNANQALLKREADTEANVAQRAAWIWQEVPVPVIAAIQGVAYGGGCQIALAADLRIAHPESSISVMEMKWGLIPDMSITQTLFRLVRADIAAELIYTARVVQADEAVHIGLCTRLHDDPVAEALQIARAIAARSPHAIRHAKRLIKDAPNLDRRGAFLLETELQLELLGSPNNVEAIGANMMKRNPNFKDVD
ncbi:MAG: crotonase/enoyl-CoA hydratase family protein [Polyangiales bacterium]